MNTDKTSLDAQSQPSCLGAVISRFFVGQKIPSAYKMNKGYTVLEIDEKRDRILMRQDGIEKPQWFTLSEFQNGL